MSKKQWIWLIVAAVVFAAVGVSSVVTNTWSARSMADSVQIFKDAFYGGVYAGTAEGDFYFPEESFLAEIDIEGTIVSSGSAVGFSAAGFDEEYILDYIDRLMDCESNIGIVLYIDSGGGEMNASDEIYLKLMDYKEATGRPIYAYFDGTACSGAYYIAMAADQIWANRNCICVNIGVYIETYNLSGLFEKYGVEEIMIKSSENKGIGAMGQPWTEEQLAIYQSIVDLYYAQFLDVVAAGRHMTTEQVRALDDGREMLAAQALEAGFIDGICRWEQFKDSLLSYYGEDVSIYTEEPSETDMFLDLLDNLYGKLAALSPVSDGELLRQFVESKDGIVVMAYAG